MKLVKPLSMWLVSVLAVALSACSSSPSPGTASPATPNVGSESTSAASASASTQSAAVDSAEKAVAAATASDGDILPTTPLRSKPPTNKTVVFLQCEQSLCPLQGEGIEAAAKALGWTMKTLNFQAADPATLVTALKTALQFKPVAVYFAGPPQEIWGVVAKDYQRAGTYLVPSSVPDVKSGGSVLPSTVDQRQNINMAKLLANVVIADSNGSASALFVNLSTSPIYVPMVGAFDATLRSACPSTCSSQTLDVTIPQLTNGQVTPAVVSALRRNPSIKYVVAANGPLLQGLSAAMRTAGVTGVKLVSSSGLSTNEDEVKRGEELATAVWSFQYVGWLSVDETLRAMEGMPGEINGTAPALLITQKNVGTGGPAEKLEYPANYQSQFKKLWRV